jgi:hypothetical protein
VGAAHRAYAAGVIACELMASRQTTTPDKAKAPTRKTTGARVTKPKAAPVSVVRLPCAGVVYVDLLHISAVRTEPTGVGIHTTEAYGFMVSPVEDETVTQLAEAIAKLWLEARTRAAAS